LDREHQAGNASNLQFKKEFCVHFSLAFAPRYAELHRFAAKIS
jgi:hypothetical protein